MSAQRESDRTAVARLRDGFFAAHLAAHPEESTTFGLRGHAGGLSDLGAAAMAAELDRLRETLRAVQALQAEHAAGRRELSLDDRLDLDAIARHVRFHERCFAADTDVENLELLTLPSSALQHDALHLASAADVLALAARAAAVPRFLDCQADNLRRGVRSGRAPDRAVVAAFVQRILPGAAKSCAALAGEVTARLAADRIAAPEALARLAASTQAASAAYSQLAKIIEQEVAPAARVDVKLGAPEVAFRLREVMGLALPIAHLLEQARFAAQRAQESLIEHVRAAGHPNARTAGDARAVLLTILAEKPSTIAAALERYTHHLEAATRFVKERALVPVPEGLALSLAPLPAGIAEGTALTNWPAPLLRPGGRGHALYAPEPSAHSLVQTKNLAVHEGIPGHYLQSAWWQRTLPSPVRFLGVSDAIAMARGYFGTMLAVEGWAVHMEELLLAEGFYAPGPERIFFAFCDMIRAMRVMLDLQLHAGGLTEDEAERLVMDATLMPQPWARAQVLRAKRIPLQSLTYLVGATELAALRARSSLSQLAFHRELLRFGPVPPSRLYEALGS